jgi:hypothetical protein
MAKPFEEGKNLAWSRLLARKSGDFLVTSEERMRASMLRVQAMLCIGVRTTLRPACWAASFPILCIEVQRAFLLVRWPNYLPQSSNLT